MAALTTAAVTYYLAGVFVVTNVATDKLAWRDEVNLEVSSMEMCRAEAPNTIREEKRHIKPKKHNLRGVLMCVSYDKDGAIQEMEVVFDE